MNAVSIILPIMLVAALGAWLGRRGHYAEEFFRDANRLTYYIGLPALLFREVAEASLRGSQAGPTILVMLGAAITTTLFAVLLTRLRRLPSARAGAVISCAFRGNIAYVGLPIVLYTLPPASPEGISWGATAALCLAPIVLVYNVACVLICRGLTRGTAGGRGAMFRSIALNPLILSSAAGGLVAMFGLPLPEFVSRTLRIIGNMALPIALLALGASMDVGRLRREYLGWATTAALLKTSLSPFMGWLLARAMALKPEETLIALVYLSCPTAVSMYVMAKPLGVDERLTGAVIALSTLVSVVPLTVTLMLFAP